MYESDTDLILVLASSEAPFSTSKTDNWVARAGGLPPYVRKLARGIMKSGGHDLSSAISIAIERIKVWAAGGGKVNAKTRAEAAKALAQWEKAKAKSHVKLTSERGGEPFEYLLLTNVTSFNTQIVSAAWESIQREKRDAYNAAHPQLGVSDGYAAVNQGFQWQWICELGTDYIIVNEDNDKGQDKYRYPYAVNDDYEVTFGDPTRIYQIWVEDKDDENDLSADEYADLLGRGSKQLALTHITRIAERLKEQ